MRRIVFTLAAVAGTWAASAGDSIVLARNGRPTAEIVVASDATKAARFGARELAEHLKRITGAEFAIVTPEGADPAKTAIYVGVSKPVGKLGFAADGFASQEYVLACRRRTIVLAGRDKEDRGEFRLEYGEHVGEIALEGHPNAFNWPGFFEERGSLNAVYDFLRDCCGVEWLDPTDAGTVLPSRRTLAVEAFADRRVRPFAKCRASHLRYGYNPELWRPQTGGWTNFVRGAYARAFTHKSAQHAMEAQKRIFLLRMKVGGELIVANHSFYPWYERFWKKTNDNFESCHPEYFAKGLGKDKSSGREIARGYDASEQPPQLCYSNPAVVSQAVADVRAYFDHGGYPKRYCSINAPGYHWGENNFSIEPMDNHGFCRCPDCVRQYHPERSSDRGEQSDYVFRFVKAVADEIAKSHPGKRISTLAYMSREGVPHEVRLPDNVTVHFTFHGNRMPNSPLLTQQQALLRTWRKEYPENGFGVWLYDCFPEYMAYRRGFNCFPGFFASLLADEYRFLREMDAKECIFYDGMKDDFENWLSFAWMWDPDVSLAGLKDRYFASFGKAEKSIRAFYDLVESRFCDKSLYGGNDSHQTQEVAWKFLGDDATMTRLAELMRAALQAKGLTPQAKARVANWRRGYWDYMLEGKYPSIALPCDREGVTIRRREHLWTAKPSPFGKSVLRGVPMEIVRSDAQQLVCQSGIQGLQKASATDRATDGDFESEFFIHSADDHALYICRKPIDGLARARVTVTRTDSARARCRFRLIGICDGREVELSPAVEQTTWFSPEKDPDPNRRRWQTFDFRFAKGAVPGHLDAIGIRDETPSLKAHWPRIVEFEAR